MGWMEVKVKKKMKEKKERREGRSIYYKRSVERCMMGADRRIWC